PDCEVLDRAVKDNRIEGSARHGRTDIGEDVLDIGRWILALGSGDGRGIEVAGEDAARAQTVEVPRVETVTARELEHGAARFQHETAEDASLQPQGIPQRAPLIKEIDVVVKMLGRRWQGPLDGQQASMCGGNPRSRERRFKLAERFAEAFVSQRLAQA